MGKKLWILKTGGTFAAIKQQQGDFEQWILHAVRQAEPHLNTGIIYAQQQAQLPVIAEVAAVVITGSHAMVSERDAWSERLVPWLQGLHHADIPILGICYGHQLLAHALGGRVGYHPQGIEIGSHSVSLTAHATNDPLFTSLPPQFPVQLVHRQSVLSLPEGAQVLAFTAHEAHQAFRLRTTWGVQFHPEFSSSAMLGYLQAMQQDLQAEGFDYQQLLESVVETPASASLLSRFATLVTKH